MTRYVISTDNPIPPSERDEDDLGSLFWNTEDGFGALSTATIFTEEEAQLYDLPIANDQPVWTQLPD